MVYVTHVISSNSVQHFPWKKLGYCLYICTYLVEYILNRLNFNYFFFDKPNNIFNLTSQMQMFYDNTSVLFLVATLQRHLWSNVCSKFHENWCILKPILQNRDMWVFFRETTQKGVYFDTVFWAFLTYLSNQLF